MRDNTSKTQSRPDIGGTRIGSEDGLSRGLTLGLGHKQMNLKLGNGKGKAGMGMGMREVSERKQVGDAESMINEGRGGSGMEGVFMGEGGEV
ncbi:hypothetical protein sscle_16g109620 [Sclerotinia sclerotiorum 1980 UF-70]|uniref:Uncharacterized protein n=1 Tax=Sclerotinia sclerotiorum (strain ATCC 18683 / 1980 / Ss-1) TaxID=665079 RepID=A0A1D9QN03_SCLS1|nr:hypothetical protein sscle_16g109620 [Sclerotinia sclerotiorum 1980 UF-70]